MTMVDKNLEHDMDIVLKAVTIGRAARNKANLKNRQPLSSLYIQTDMKLSDIKMLDLVADELNVKKAEIVTDNSKFVTYELKPQLKTVGPKYGKFLGGIKAYLAEKTGTDEASNIVNEVNAGNAHVFEVSGEKIELSKDDLLINPMNKPGYALEAEGNMTVVIDTNLTQELINEGISRELTSKIQTMRKEAGFEVTDHIVLGYEGEGKTVEVLLSDKSILDVVLADSLVNKIEGFEKDCDINGENIKLSVLKK